MSVLTGLTELSDSDLSELINHIYHDIVDEDETTIYDSDTESQSQIQSTIYESGTESYSQSQSQQHSTIYEDDTTVNDDEENTIISRHTIKKGGIKKKESKRTSRKKTRVTKKKKTKAKSIIPIEELRERMSIADDKDYKIQGNTKQTMSDKNASHLKEILDFLSNDDDLDVLLNTLDTESNDKIMSKTKQSIQKMKTKVLQQLGLTREKLLQFNSALSTYQYIDDLSELDYGAYIRWIGVREQDKDKIYMRKGGWLVDIMFTDTGVLLRVLILYGKNRRFISIKFDENLIFQKLSDSNMILLELLNRSNVNV